MTPQVMSDLSELRDAREHVASVLLLGTYHMANSGRDVFNIEADDVRSDHRQREIEDVVDRLLRFRPTKVAVEHALGRSVTPNSDYRHYRTGDFELSQDETHQIGFRAAARSEHELLYPIDLMVGSEVDPRSWAREHDQADVVEAMTASWHAITQRFEEMLRTGTIREALCLLNAPERGCREQELYLGLVQIGRGQEYPGADWLTGWYERNLQIFANLLRITEPGDRIFIVYGAGHIPLLRQFVRESGRYQLEQVESYLGENGGTRANR